ncbi:MAG: helix-turn-helix domain-containing protein [Planctomycetota bacterium]
MPSLVALANRYHFQPGERLANGPVRSRMLLWCRAGTGLVVHADQRLQLHAGHCLALPWGHDIAYQADRRQPFVLGGVHLLPRCDHPGRLAPGAVAHAEDDPLADAAWIGDAPLLEWPELGPHILEVDHPLIALGEYLALRFQQGSCPTALMQQAAQLLLDACKQLRRDQAAHMAWPAPLQRICRYLRADPARAADLATCARVGACSQATVVRLFRRHCGCSPGNWIRDLRLQTARRQLAGSRLPIAAVASRCGFPDQRYFSRLFRRHCGMPPGDWRRRHGGL